MKKLFKLTALFLMGFMLMTTSCEDDPEETCDKIDSDVGKCSADDITTCCNDDGSCYYTYQGTEYNSVDELAAVCTTGSMSIADISIQLDVFTQELIIKARSAADCK